MFEIIAIYIFALDILLKNEQLTTVNLPQERQPVATATPTPRVIPTIASPLVEQNTKRVGIASYYSRAGCVGCSPNLTMANGQPLDDSKLTVAYNDVPLGTMVKVTNQRTGQTVTAEVSDTGGFNKLGRIIDLSVATRDAIGCSNLCQVEVDL